MAHREGWEVGMEIVAVITCNHPKDTRIYTSVITKVGRRWITFTHTNGHGENRFDAETMQIDGAGYSSPGRVYPTMLDYEGTLEANEAWKELRQAMQWHPPKGMSADRIREIAREIARLGENRAGGGAKTDAHFLGHDLRQGGFPQAWRAIK